MRANFKGYKVLRLRESEIKANAFACGQRIIQSIFEDKIDKRWIPKKHGNRGDLVASYITGLAIRITQVDGSDYKNYGWGSLAKEIRQDYALREKGL